MDDLETRLTALESRLTQLESTVRLLDVKHEVREIIEEGRLQALEADSASLALIVNGYRMLCQEMTSLQQAAASSGIKDDDELESVSEEA